MVHRLHSTDEVSYRNSTCYSYEKICNKWVNQHLSDKELRKITKLDIHEILYKHVVGERSPIHQKIYFKNYKANFSMAVDHGKIDRNPCQRMMIKVPETEQKVLTNAEVEKPLYEAKVTNHRFYPIWIVALTGLTK